MCFHIKFDLIDNLKKTTMTHSRNDPEAKYFIDFGTSKWQEVSDLAYFRVKFF